MDEILFSTNFTEASGIEVSKGERVVNALQKLWQKLQLLEQARQLEKEKTNKEHDGYNMPELQQKLLELQLQYVRSILLRNNGTGTTTAPINKPDVRVETPERDEVRLSSLHDYSDPGNLIRDSCDKHTQTSSGSTRFTNSPCLDNQTSSSGSMKKTGSIALSVKGKKEFIFPHNCEQKNLRRQIGKSQALSSGLRQRNLSTHYHLKLTDVPFIIGTSTSSHSVIANVQKIISLMKIHNKGLCSSAPNLARKSPSSDFGRNKAVLGCKRTYSNPDLSGPGDLNGILLCLNDELATLKSKLEGMKRVIESPHSHELSPQLLEDYVNTMSAVDVKSKQISALRKALKKQPADMFSCRRRRSLSESTPCSRHTEKLLPGSKDISFINNISKSEVKQVICSFSDTSSKAAASGRRKMLRELKEFQLHLQQEDIYWK